MSDETLNQETTQEQEHQTQEQNAQERLYTKEELEKRMAGPIGQINELKQQLQSYQAKKAQEEEEKLLKNKEYDTLLANYKAQLEAKDAEMSSYKNEIKTQKIDGALFRAGIKDEFTRIGVLTKYSQLEEKPDIDSFLGGLKESSPHLFENNTVPKGKPSGSVGLPVQNGAGAPLSERLKSSDPNIARAAIRERLERRAKGLPVD